MYLYPDFPVLRSLLAGLTLPRQERTEVTDQQPSSPPDDMPPVVLLRPSSPWSVTELAPFSQRIATGSPIDGKLPVLPIWHRVFILHVLLKTEFEYCLSSYVCVVRMRRC